MVACLVQPSPGRSSRDPETRVCSTHPTVPRPKRMVTRAAAEDEEDSAGGQRDGGLRDTALLNRVTILSGTRLGTPEILSDNETRHLIFWGKLSDKS